MDAYARLVNRDALKVLTIGDLRAELVGWPDDTPLVVVVPDRGNPDAVAVLPVVAVGYGSGVEAGSDPVLASTFPLAVEWHD